MAYEAQDPERGNTLYTYGGTSPGIEAESHPQWGGLVLLAAGLGLGMAAHKTGVATYIAYTALGNIIGPLPEFMRLAVTSWFTATMHALFPAIR